MCKEGTVGQWGPDTCIPTFDNADYQRYVKLIVSRAIDAGIVNFLIGQTGHVDARQRLGPFLRDLRIMATSKGATILIGQQPNGIQPESYLRIFDYIVGPVYVGWDVSGPCLPGTNCQAIQYHPSIASKPTTSSRSLIGPVRTMIFTAMVG